jgi:hypothetical protein
MNSTSILSVITSFKAKDKLSIHPNDGCDIGLFNHSYVKKFFMLNDDESVSSISFECEILLLNECKNGTIEIGNNFWQRLGKPGMIKLSINDDKMYIKKMD